MDPHFQELAATISRDVSASVKRDLTEVLTRDITAIVKRDITEIVKRDVTEIVKRDVSEALKHHVTEVVTAAERRLSKQALVNVEAVREEAKLAAEGYAATVDAIDGRLDRMEAKMDAKFGDYDAVLKNHNQRITALDEKST